GAPVKAVADVDLDLAGDEIVGLIGASGSGKSTLAAALIGGLDARTQLRGSIAFAGRELGRDERAWSAVRGRGIALIPQDPAAALNPCRRIGSQLAEVVRVLRSAGRREARDAAVAALAQVRFGDPGRAMTAYPHELSIGQRQRVVIALALLGQPRVLLLDEPTASLDATVAAAVIDLLGELRAAGGPAQLLISHSLGLVRRICRRVLVIDGGRVVEAGPTEQLLTRPRHAATRRLADAARTPGRAAQRPRAAPRTAAAAPVVEVDRLGKVYVLPADSIASWLGMAPRRHLVANRDLSFAAGARTIIGIVGESGCGKSTLAKMLIGLETATSGRALLRREEVARKGVRERSPSLRAFAQMVFQSPSQSLNPRRRIGAQLRRAITLLAGERPDRRAVAELLARVSLDPEFARRRPSELSGGQCQRVAIARALAGRPGVLLADEPFSALDGVTTASIADVFHGLRDDGTTTLLITHDIAVLRGLADRIVVMLGGVIVESGPAEAVLAPPFHPYTERLLAAMPGIDGAEASVHAAPMPPPSARPRQSGCVFADRCRRRLGTVCETDDPPLRSPAPGHDVRCHIPVERLAQPSPVGNASP
ncbi:MAG: ABC transporter ATP-binding protein, partial [Rhodospirillales bacterium]|nr:ABC transporter ATP-binding protein [Rhodospirillales bacterium]